MDDLTVLNSNVKLETNSTNLGYLNQSLNSNSQAVYIIKIKGKAKIPDYIQLRDESFVLVAYFRADRELKNLNKFGLGGKERAHGKADY